MEYVPGGILFDVIHTLGSCGEDGGRFFLRQLLDFMDHVQENNVAHRDLKLENILIDKDMNLKVADFGFATYTHGGKLFSYRGTKTYMAPEIRTQKEYDGHKVDVFSLGVILFIVVMGIFPFLNADLSDPYYRHIATKNHDSYWLKMGVSR